MKFLVIFISMILILFGGLFCLATSLWIDDLRKKINYDNLNASKKQEFDKRIKDVNTYTFGGVLLGICLFVAGLFI